MQRIGVVRMTKYICDRCKSDIEKETEVYRVIACKSIGISVQYDLCEKCYDKLNFWLNTKGVEITL